MWYSYQFLPRAGIDLHSGVSNSHKSLVKYGAQYLVDKPYPNHKSKQDLKAFYNIKLFCSITCI